MPSRKYISKPVVIEARRIDSMDYDGMCELIRWCGGRAVGEDTDDRAVIAIDTLEGTMLAEPGDWIIRGVAGEFYPCKDSVFQRKYQPARLDGTEWVPA